MTSSRKIAEPLQVAHGAPRVALYLRVSTDRQVKGDVSLPSQRKLTRTHCLQQGWDVVEEYVEPGLTADDRRPVFQQMIERACDPDRPFDIILVHAFSRFYRDHIGMELTVRKLRKHGVTVISMTQVVGEDPSSQLVRQMIGLFDEYSSKENAKQVTRAMRENAAQGFWNGATAPLGYAIVAAEQRGQKIKKKLAVDAVEAELVHLIFRLYLEGDPESGMPPMGIKEVVSWLNAKGYQTRKGGSFGVGSLHHVLTNTAYVGRWKYGVRNSKTRAKHPEESVVEITVPRILDDAVFDGAQTKLKAHNPRMTAVRANAGPILLTGLAVCAHCGAGMTQRTGTSKNGRVYTYYTCGSRAQKGKTACPGNAIPMPLLDDLVVDAVNSQLLRPERLAVLLEDLMSRQTERVGAIDRRIADLKKKADDADERLRRLYKLVEDGIAEMDAPLGERIGELQKERNLAKGALDRARNLASARSTITADKITAFAKLMREKLSTGDVVFRKNYLRTILGAVEVYPDKVRLLGSKDVLQAAIANKNLKQNGVQSFGPKWRARKDSNL
ncbi:recombinase family protein [Devosia faecipullorum]|uniref:recombinase family protein n=1 Tax=Devosia faecipullorum TaxID=2755039 RepID=UPI00187B91AA|nr:recombinase family protein [Devosia faecipullorum]MBE7733257.1 recombinase family protein [Devosia faecipullorum]